MMVIMNKSVVLLVILFALSLIGQAFGQATDKFAAPPPKQRNLKTSKKLVTADPPPKKGEVPPPPPKKKTSKKASKKGKYYNYYATDKKSKKTKKNSKKNANLPSSQPSESPTTTFPPSSTFAPTKTFAPTRTFPPTALSQASSHPSEFPSVSPSSDPSANPTNSPSTSPSSIPTSIPSVSPSADPSVEPSSQPSDAARSLVFGVSLSTLPAGRRLQTARDGFLTSLIEAATASVDSVNSNCRVTARADQEQADSSICRAEFTQEQVDAAIFCYRYEIRIEQRGTCDDAVLDSAANAIQTSFTSNEYEDDLGGPTAIRLVVYSFQTRPPTPNPTPNPTPDPTLPPLPPYMNPDTSFPSILSTTRGPSGLDDYGYYDYESAGSGSPSPDSS